MKATKDKFQPLAAKAQPRKTIALEGLEVIGPTLFGEGCQNSIGDMAGS